MMRVFGNFWGTAVIAAIVATSFGGPLGAVEIAPDLKRKINVAGTQRMLSQRMAKAACFRSLGVGGADHVEVLANARTRFARALAGLRDGDTSLGTQPEDNPAVLAALDDVTARWQTYEAALDHAHEDRDALVLVAADSLPVLKASNDVVLALEASNVQDGVSQELARLINVSGRQRMLTQKAAKEFCLIAAGIDAEAQRMSLAQTVALFDRSLAGLLAGDDDMGLIGAPDDLIFLQLEHVGDLWGPLRSQFMRVVDGANPGPTALFTVSANIDTVLKAADEAVWLYENF